MTGLELVPAAAEVTIGIATKVVERALNHLFRRRRIVRRVIKTVPFKFPRSAYRKWLTALPVTKLAQSIDVIGPELAKSFNQILVAAALWANDPERDSKALAVVEATYDAIVRFAEPADAAALRDGWARARHSVLVTALVASLGEAPHLARSDFVEMMRAESRARREVRLGSFGLKPDDLQAALDLAHPRYPSTASGEVRTLIGPFGSGKSELAESSFRTWIDRYSADGSEPMPLWLHASELAGTSLTVAVGHRAAPGTVSATGVAVVIDGLDEVDGLVATQISAQANLFVAAHPSSSFLLTSRPGVLAGTEDQTLIDGLEHGQAVELVELVAGSDRSTWGWDPLLVDAIKRPFFAIAAGVLLRDGDRPTGQADLIRQLVERALRNPTSASIAMTSSSLYRVLIKLAVAGTDTGNRSDGLTFQERQLSLTSTLVSERVGGRVEYSLPIFQQWFAAQSLLADGSSFLSTAVHSPETFGRWRWAVAIAALAAEPLRLDAILEECFLANPGVGSWVLSRVADGHRWFRDPGAELGADNAPSRLLRSTRTLIESIGPLAPHVYPVTSSEQPVTLGVRVDGNRVSTGWSKDIGDDDRVVLLPSDIHPLTGGSDTWRPDRSGVVAEGEEWPWILSRDRVQAATLPLLNHHSRLGPIGGVWDIESCYRAARIVSGGSGIYTPPIDASALVAKIEGLLQLVEDPSTSQFQFQHRTLTGLQLLRMLDWVKQLGVESIERPLPAADIPPEELRGHWIWDFYSSGQLAHFYAEAYGRACTAYDEAVSTLFAKFDWSLGHRGAGEFGVVIDLRHSKSAGTTLPTPGVSGAILPTELMDEAIKFSGAPSIWSANRRAAIVVSESEPASPDWVRRFVEMQYELAMTGPRADNPFANGWSTWRSVADDIGKTRPSSDIAARWLFADLKNLDLGTGTFPMLDNYAS